MAGKKVKKIASKIVKKVDKGVKKVERGVIKVRSGVKRSVKEVKKEVKKGVKAVKKNVKKVFLFAHKTTIVPSGYLPSEKEAYMNPIMKEYFRLKLLKWRAELLAEGTETLAYLQENNDQPADLSDRATNEIDNYLELRNKERDRKLVTRIDECLQKIADGSFGYCEETGDPIGIKRLEARPVAKYTVEVQERHERLEKTYAK